jgi:hypothetical protein
MIDERAYAYPLAVRTAAFHLLLHDGDWTGRIDRAGVDAVVVPDASVFEGLALEDGWHRMATRGDLVLLRHR